MKNILILILSFLISFVLLFKSINFLNRYFVDLPNSRSSHFKEKPQGGGFIFVLNSLFISIINFDISLTLSIPLAFIGLLDDKINLSRKFRFFSQIITVFLILIIIGIPSYLNFLPFYITFPFLILLGTSIINFTNFMDGIDGIVAGCFGVIFIMASLLLDNLYIPIVSSIAAFLFFNWEPSKVFMGDLGSTFLGSIFFTMVVNCKSFEHFLAFLIMSLPLMFDAFFCVTRRFLSGKKIFQPHRDHLYQRLCDSGISHAKVSLIYILSTTLISLSYLYFGIYSTFFVAIFILFFGIYLDKRFAMKFIENKN